ncbi:hypothetical protein OSC27_07440 [Microbacterium sp. STN6]|uniref:hypothetical protein n=1 Tax=Microbacterium sp. STN6 TaxID=2995588 RepID=UPI002260CCC7|nr:hypothetical protein [Microbacterium sp. STN6]MCX7522110.1 hypothetical protein [Microbacterium sp. STN6]
MHTRRHAALRVIGTVGLIAGPASLIVTTVIQWVLQSSPNASGPADVAQAQPALWAVAGLLAVLGPAAWIGGMPAVVDLAPNRGWVMTVIGGVVTAFGLAAGIGHLALFFGLSADLAAAGVGAHAVDAVQGADDAGLLGTVLLMVFLVAFSAGPILLALGLRRARSVPVWVPVAAIIMTVASFAGGIPAGIIQFAALLATFVPIIVALWRAPRLAADPRRPVIDAVAQA